MNICLFIVCIWAMSAGAQDDKCIGREADRCYMSGHCSDLYFCCIADGSSLDLACESKNDFYDEASNICLPKTSCMAAPAVQPESASTVTCSGMPDGRYPWSVNACSARHRICAQGIENIEHCEHDLRFDVVTRKCEIRVLVAACANGDTIIEDPKTVVIPGVAVATETQTSGPADPPRPLGPHGSVESDHKTLDCRNHEDGDYPIPDTICIAAYMRCDDGKAKIMECPTGTFFDAVSLKCYEPSQLPMCMGKIPQDGPPAPKETEPAGKGPEKEKHLEQGDKQPEPAPVPKPPQTEPEFTCVGKDDGNFPDNLQQCSSTYYSCSKGQPTQFSCPPDSKYDEETKQCLPSSQVRACSGKLAETQPSEGDQPPVVTKDAFNCTGRQNGDYEREKCSPKYFSCLFGETYEKVCSEGFLFNQENGLCQVVHDVVACSNEPKKVGPIIDVIPSTEAPKITERPKDSRDPMCANKTRGYYGDPRSNCSPVYFSCHGESTFNAWLICKGGLFFDTTIRQCNVKQNIALCIEAQKPTQQMEEVTNAPSVAKPYFNCTNKAKGNYAYPSKACSNMFFTCTGSSNEGVYRECYKKLFYDPVSNKCTLFEMISVCSGVTQTPLPNQELFTLQMGPSGTVDELRRKFCTNLKAGNYPIPNKMCTQNFFSCTEDKLFFERWCSFGEYYNAQANLCMPKDKIPGCSA